MESAGHAIGAPENKLRAWGILSNKEHPDIAALIRATHALPITNACAKSATSVRRTPCPTGYRAVLDCTLARGAANSLIAWIDCMTKERLAAFTDGVIAIIITIMVLELKAPHDPGWASLASLLPVFLSYVL